MTWSGSLARGIVATFVVGWCVACGDEKAGAPTGDNTYDWEAMSADDERESTHLWIVARAVDGLAAHPEVRVAARAVQRLRDPVCQGEWHRGLLEADYKKEYNNGVQDLPVGAGNLETIATGASWESHFWDPDTKLNYKGHAAPVARDESLRHVAEAKQAFASDPAKACYEIGLALHYFTDLTQPMHAANFTAIDLPIKLHSNYEGWAMKLHATTELDTRVIPTLAPPEDVILSTAVRSKLSWAPIHEAIADAYLERCTVAQIATLGLTDVPSCWEGDARVETLTKRALSDAVQATASYLMALDLPE